MGEFSMMMTSEWVAILDEADELSTMILSSDIADRLRKAHHAVYSSVELNEMIRQFNKTKELYEDVQRFGKYHPDYQIVMKNIRQQKRALDVDERIAALKVAENDYQDLLDEISLLVGKTVSDAVKVPVSNPFFASNGGGCSSGSCGTGGGCSCSA